LKPKEYKRPIWVDALYVFFFSEKKTQIASVWKQSAQQRIQTYEEKSK
jgi:hypothetical protein